MTSVEARRAYRLRNRDKIRLQRKAYRIRNREKIKERRRAYWLRMNKNKSWQLQNREKKKAYRLRNYEKLKKHAREYYNTPEGKAYQRKYYIQHRESQRTNARRYYRNSPLAQEKAKKRGWIIIQLCRMARDDGLWKLLEQEYENGQRSLRQTDAKPSTRARSGNQLSNAESRSMENG